jgi:hypothetical protein
MNNIFWAIIGSIVGAIVVLILEQFLNFLKSRNRDYSGRWEQVIYDENGKIVKKDEVACRQIGDSLSGEIHRFDPSEQNSKKWKFKGKIKGNFFFGMFWAIDVRTNPKSYGTLQLYITNANLMKGFYVKLQDVPDETKFSQELKQVRFEWKRIS